MSDKRQELIAKALKDEAFAAELAKNPNAAIEQAAGVRIPAGMTVKVLRDTAALVHLVIPCPPKAPAGQLSDEALSSVSGGATGPSGIPKNTQRCDNTSPTPVDLRLIAARGATLGERLNGPYAPVASAAGAALARERLERWRAAIDRGVPGRLERRLAWDGLDAEAVLARLGEVRLEDGAPAPAWASFFADSLARGVPPGLLDPKDPAPFEEILAPIAGAAWERLSVAPGARRLGEGAARVLRRDLLRGLGAIAAPSLARELQIRRAVTVSGFEALFRDPTVPPSRLLYEGLVADATGPGRSEFWLARSAVARALATAAIGWAEAIAEMLARLDADAPGLEKTFGISPNEAVSVLDFTASDAHDSGRRVGLFTFASGARVVYKPRGAALLSAWEAFLEELDRLGAPEPHRRRGTFAPGPHVWLEFVSRAPCLTAEDVSRYYVRAGHMLALMHVLQARDLHFENILAVGDAPLAIDLEVILQGDARRPGSSGPTALDNAAGLLDRSVFATGLLPIWPEDQDDFGALGAGVDRTVRQPRWKAVNTDEMAVEWEEVAREEENSRVVFEGKPVDAYAHCAEVVSGFRAGARFLAGISDRIRDGGAYGGLVAAPVRALLRATSVYSKLGSLALDLQGPADGVDRSLVLESLAAAWAQDDASRELWPLGRSEIRALEGLDIPIVHARPDGAEAWGPDGERAPLMRLTGREASLGAWKALDETGIAFQESILRASMIGRVSVDPAAAAAAPRSNPAPFAAESALALAGEIAADAGSRAVRSPQGLAWIEPAFDSKMTHLKLTLLGPKYYDGTAGIALFAAAKGERSLAREAAGTLIGLSESDARASGRALGIGGGVGVAGAAYALARAGAFLGDEAFIEAARTLARAADSGAIEEAREFDVMFGLAGAAMSLLGLHAVDPRAEWLERAAQCGERLLATREGWEGGPRAWRGKDGGPPAGGFSHGSAGAACALWRLGAATGDARFLEAAREAWAFDDSLFLPAEGAWRRHAADDGREGRHWSTWCWGAPGSGLSRLEAAAAGDAAALAGVERALTVVRASAPRGMDHLCCGEFGVTDFLLEAGLALKRPELVELARVRAAARFPAGRGLGLRIHPTLPPGPTSPTFFGGTAGIGYALLRLAEPERLPCVIAWR